MQASTHMDEDRLTGEFIERRRGTRRRLLVVPLALALLWGVFLLPSGWWLAAAQIGGALVLLYLGYVLWWLWKHWRCPACDSFFAGLKGGVSPWFSSAPLRCPYCGRKLL